MALDLPIALDEQKEIILEGRIGTLLTAASKNNVTRIRDLINAGVPSASSNYDQRTALHLACSEGHIEAAQLLVNKGADPNAKDRFGSTPLDDATRGNHLDLVEFLEAIQVSNRPRDMSVKSHGAKALTIDPENGKGETFGKKMTEVLDVVDSAAERKENNDQLAGCLRVHAREVDQAEKDLSEQEKLAADFKQKAKTALNEANTAQSNVNALRIYSLTHLTEIRTQLKRWKSKHPESSSLVRRLRNVVERKEAGLMSDPLVSYWANWSGFFIYCNAALAIVAVVLAVAESQLAPLKTKVSCQVTIENGFVMGAQGVTSDTLCSTDWEETTNLAKRVRVAQIVFLWISLVGDILLQLLVVRATKRMLSVRKNTPEIYYRRKCYDYLGIAFGWVCALVAASVGTQYAIGPMSTDEYRFSVLLRGGAALASQLAVAASNGTADQEREKLKKVYGASSPIDLKVFGWSNDDTDDN